MKVFQKLFRKNEESSECISISNCLNIPEPKYLSDIQQKLFNNFTIQQNINLSRLGFFYTNDNSDHSIFCNIMNNIILSYENIQILDLSYNRLQFIPNSFKELINLKELLLCCNHLGSKTENENDLSLYPIQYLNNLNKLDISYNYISNISYIPINITYLSVKHNRTLQLLPEDFYKNYHLLTFLDLSYCNLLSIILNNNKDNNISLLKSLQILKLEGNRKLDCIPKELELLHNLEYISIFHHPIPSIPDNFGINCLLSLQYLDIHRCWIQKLPESLGLLKNLKYLNISMNHFTKFPNIICSLVNLIQLKANAFEWNTLPNDFKNLCNLTILELRFNRFIEINENIYFLNNLQHLDLSGNSITIIPDKIDNLYNLQNLNLNDNITLNMIPKSLQKLTNLSNLGLENTEILTNIQDNYPLIYQEYLINNIKLFLNVYFDKDNINTLLQEKKNNSNNIHHKVELTNDEFKDKVYGIIFGVALGDAIGLSTEFQSSIQAKVCYGNGRPSLSGDNWGDNIFRDNHRIHWQNYDWTDDTDQLLLILKAFCDNPELSKDLILTFAKYLLSWAHRGFPELGDVGGAGIGQTLTKVLLHKDFLTYPHTASKEIYEKSNGRAAANGGLMRTAITGIPFYYDLEKTIELTISLCKVTHSDPRCYASAVAVSTSIAMILQGYKDHEFIRNSAYVYALSYTPQQYHQELKEYIFANNFKELKLDEAKSIGYTFKAMGCAFVSLIHYNNFEDAIIQLTMEAGDADTNGAVAGGLMGAVVGYSNLPKNWKTKLLHHEWLMTLIDEFIGKIKKP